MAKRTARKQRMAELYLFEQNAKAIQEGPTRRKSWSKHDIRNITPLTDNQTSFFQQFFQGDNIAALGSAGTGKTFLALYLAICDVIDKNKPQERIIIVRSAVPTRDLGFMPGTIEEKASLYEMPYRDTFKELFGRSNTYDDMKEAGLIQFVTTSYIRGVTWDDAIIVVDEIQNMTMHEINSIMTRVGVNSRVVVAGDIAQNDLNKRSSDKSGIERFARVISKIPQFSTVWFTHDDIVRSEFVKQWIIASDTTLD